MPGDQVINKQQFEELFGVSQDFIKSMQLQSNNIMQDRFDKSAFERLATDSAELGNLAKKGEDSNKPTYPALLQDIWAAFYKYVPEMAPESNIDSSHKLNRPLIERLLEDNETNKLRITTVMDEMSAGLATLEAGRKLLQEIEERPELKEVFEKGANRIGQAEQAGEDAGEALKEYLDSMQKNAKEIRRAMREAVQQAAQETNKMQQAFGGWGFDPGDFSTAPLGERLTIAKRLMNPRVMKLAELVGRFRNLARSRQKNKIEHARDELHSITTGNDIQHMLPSELAAIRHPVRKLDFYRKYTERTALQYDLKSKEKKNRGPMIIAIDTSGSMNGEPLEWAIATALALVDTATRQKRRAKVMFFSTQVIKRMEFEPGEKNIEKLMEMATVGTGGGTAFEPPMAEALEAIQTTNYKNADFVFISDGICRVDEDFLNKFMATKKALVFSVWTVLIGYEADDQLKAWSNKVWPVDRLTEDVAGDIFEAVI
jgi:uncharacterized protein with von Willebrand factor type A (vWA) domain